MATNIIHLQNLRSKDIIQDSLASYDVAKNYDGTAAPKLPSGEQLEYGDIALNIAKGYETLAVKNFDGSIVYLPFNLTSRVYNIEHDTVSGIEKEIQSIKEDVKDIQSGSSEDINNLKAIVTQHTELIYGNSSNIAIISNNISALTSSVEEIKEEIKGLEGEGFSALTKSLGFDGTNYVPQSQELSGKNVTEAIDYAIKSINEIDVASIRADINALKEVSGKTDIIDSIVELINNIELIHAKAFVEISNSIGLNENAEYVSNVEALKGYTMAEAIDTTYNHSNEVVKQQNKVIADISGKTIAALNNFEKSVDEKIQDCSAKTLSEFNEKLTIFSGEVNNQFYAFSSSTSSALTQITQETDEKLAALSSVSTTELNKVVSGINETIDTKERTINSNIEALSGKVGTGFDSLKLTLETEINETASALSGSFKSNIEVVSGILLNTIFEVENNFDEEIQKTNDRLETGNQILSGNIQSVSDRTSNLEGAVNDISAYTTSLESHLTEDELIRARVIAQFNEQLGFNENGEYEPINHNLSARSVSEAIDYLSDKTDALDSRNNKAISDDLKALSGAIDTTNAVIELTKVELLANDEEVLESAQAYTDNAINTSTEKIDTVDTKLNTTIAEFNQTIESLNETIDSKEKKINEDIAALDEKVGDGFDALKDEIETEISGVAYVLGDAIESLSGTVDTVSGSLATQIEITDNKLSSEISGVNFSLGEEIKSTNKTLQSSVETINNDIHVVSGRVSILESNIKEVSGYTSDIESRLAEDELIRARAIAQFNCELGFNENGEFEPLNPNLSGRSIAEAMDYLSDRTDVLDARSNAEIDQRLKDLSGAISTTNERLDESVYNLNEQDKNVLISSQTYTDNVVSGLTNKINNVDVRVTENTEALKELVNDVNVTLSGQISSLTITVSENKSDQVKENARLNLKIDTLDVELSKKIVDNVTSAKTDLSKIIEANRSESNNNDAKIVAELNEVEKNNAIFSAETVQSLNVLNETADKFEISLNAIDESVGELQTETNILSATTEDLKDENEAIGRYLEDDEIVKARVLAEFNTQLGFDENGQFNPYTPALSSRTVTEAIDYLYDRFSGLSAIESAIKEDYKRMHIQTVTYNHLMQLVNNKKLTWGTLYRIQDYEPIINNKISGLSVRSHVTGSIGFYIIVKAIGRDILDENAWAAPYDYDTKEDQEDSYFDYAVSNAWTIKYCLKNDTDRFDWASSSGRGVIYYMKDEFGNEAPYDFKNILINGLYTFNNQDGGDLSINGIAYGNIIRPCINEGKYIFNKIQISARQMYGNTFNAGCSSFTFDGSTFTDNIIASSIEGKELTDVCVGKLLGFTVG